jgi:hypothetical protein
MIFYTPELRQIIQQSFTLAERLRLQYTQFELSQDEPIVNSRLETWCKVVAGDDWKKFEQRLAWDNLDLCKVRKVICSVSIVEDIPLPTWAETLNECLKAASSIKLEELVKRALISQLLDPEIPLVFEELLLPFINVARNKLKNHAASYYLLLSTNAHASLERSLLRSLSQACRASLEFEFSLFRITKQSTVAHF